MNEYDCGCLITADDASGYFIHACNKHNAAPDLLEACEELLEAINPLLNDPGLSPAKRGGHASYAISTAQAAIAKARGS